MDKPNEKRAAWLRGVIEAATAELEGREGEAKALFVAQPWERFPPETGAFWTGCEYRAKPQPKYRPLSRKEAIELEGKHVVERKVSDPSKCMIVGSSKLGIFIQSPCAKFPYWVGYCRFVDEYAFADDGTPCGMLVEGES